MHMFCFILSLFLIYEVQENAAICVDLVSYFPIRHIKAFLFLVFDFHFAAKFCTYENF